tara:strand:+ start:246 stop:593 length:348 start_codon:yes stop_codon:yes gene_type:complete
MPKYYQAGYFDREGKRATTCDTSLTEIEKKVKEKVLEERVKIFIEAVEIPPLSLRGFTKMMNLEEYPLSRELLSVFSPRQTTKGWWAKKMKIRKQKKRTENITFKMQVKELQKLI